MKRLLLALLATTCMTGTAHALTVWQGEAVIDSATASCTNASSAVGVDTIVKSVFRPKLVADNGNDHRITFVQDSMANQLLILPGGAASGTAAAFGVTSSGVLKANVGTPYTSFVIAPATVTAATQNLTIRGRVSSFLFIPGCTVTFRAAYSIRN